MFGKFGKARLLAALLVSSLAMAAFAAGASAGVPGNLRAQLFKFNAACIKLHQRNNQCAMGQYVISYAKKHHAPMTRGWKAMLALYAQMAPVCGRLRPNSSDGRLSIAQVTLFKQYIEFDCAWGPIGLNAPEKVEIAVAVPLVAHRMPPMPACDEPLGYVKVAGGCEHAEPYSSATGSSLTGVYTVNGYAQIKRISKNQSQSLFYGPRDYSVLTAIDKALGLTS